MNSRSQLHERNHLSRQRLSTHSLQITCCINRWAGYFDCSTEAEIYQIETRAFSVFFLECQFCVSSVIFMTTWYFLYMLLFVQIHFFLLVKMKRRRCSLQKKISDSFLVKSKTFSMDGWMEEINKWKKEGRNRGMNWKYVGK